MRKYRVYYNNSNTSYTEDTDLGALQARKAAMGYTKPILQVDMQFRIQDDPELRTFEDYDVADQARYNLRESSFEILADEAYTDPQPTDLG